MKISAFFDGLPKAFRDNGYDYDRFMRIFGWGSIGIWVLVVSSYLVFDSEHTFGGAVVSVLAALLATLVLFPLAVNQSSKEFDNAFDFKRHPKPPEPRIKKVKRKSQQRG